MIVTGNFNYRSTHGASEQEIQIALEKATGVRKKGLSRRELIKYAVAGGLALAATGLTFSHAPNSAQATSYYFGIDSNTTICCSMPLNFYIGRMGYGVYPDTSYYAFNLSMAKQAGLYNTFGYWGVQGPDATGAKGKTPYNWGAAQADEALKAWNGGFVGSLPDTFHEA